MEYSIWLFGLTVTLLEEITVQRVGVITWEVFLLLQVALEEISRGDVDLSLGEEFGLTGVLGSDELLGIESKGRLNKHLATLDPWTNGSSGRQLSGDDRIAQEGWAISWHSTALSDCGSVFTPARRMDIKFVWGLEIRSIRVTSPSKNYLFLECSWRAIYCEISLQLEAHPEKLCRPFSF